MSRSAVSVCALAAVGLALGCAGRGRVVHDVTPEVHEAVAAQEERAASAQEALYDPTAEEARARCRSYGRAGGVVCWTSVVNPTEKHLREAAEHRKQAAEHRAAARALRDAEGSSCAGVGGDDRDMSPFYHREDVVRVEPITTGAPPDGGAALVKGAAVVFRAVPGLTVEWLQRVVDCHIARNSAMGDEATYMPYCPLALKGVTATVSPAEGGIAVEIRAEDPEAANEVLRRAEQLVVR